MPGRRCLRLYQTHDELRFSRNYHRGLSRQAGVVGLSENGLVLFQVFLNGFDATDGSVEAGSA